MRPCLSVLIYLCLLLSGCASTHQMSQFGFEKSTQCSKQGDVSAQFNKGYAYSNGQGVPRDKAKAAQWYRKSAEQCYAPAEFMLGLSYEQGEGVMEDKLEASRWYQKAGEQGFSNASKRLVDLKKDERIAQLIAKEEWETTRRDYNLGMYSGAFFGGISTIFRNPNGLIASELERENLISIKVFYGTDRTIKGSSTPKKFFGNQRGNLVFGACEVSIPRDHKMGEVESPNWFKFQFREDPEQHVVLLDVTPQSEEDFFSSLHSRIKSSKGKQAFVFVHGYNVSFADAARRTAQISYDLGFDGAPIFFSWPSQDETVAYTVDEANEEWAVPHLKSFLTDVSLRTGAETIYLIAHSMGTRALSSALREIASERPDKKLFKEVVLAAPDIDAEVFQRDILPKIRPIASRITLYASSKDKALQASKEVHGYPRAGESEMSSLVIAPGLDTIDASLVDTSFIGHSYFADNRSVISDIYNLFRNGNPPDQRNLMEKSRKGLKYWAFKL